MSGTEAVAMRRPASEVLPRKRNPNALPRLIVEEPLRDKKGTIGRRVSVRLRKLTNSANKAFDVPPQSRSLPVLSQPTTIYGQPLGVVLGNFGGPIPPLVKYCTRRLRNSLGEEGIFRVSGMASSVYAIGELFAEPNQKSNLEEFECHAVAGAYKKFFRDLPQPLFTTALYDDMIAASQTEEPVGDLRACLALLPLPNYFIIKHVLKLLHKASKQSEQSKMQPSNLGIVFGPTLMRSQKENDTGVGDICCGGRAAMVVEKLIVHYKEIFKDLPHPGLANSTQGPTRTPMRLDPAAAVTRGRSSSCVGDSPFGAPDLRDSVESSTPRRLRKSKKFRQSALPEELFQEKTRDSNEPDLASSVG